MISAMSVQQESVRKIIERCHGLETKVVAGGPLFTLDLDRFADVDVLVLGEAEVTLPPFLDDVRHQRLQHCYASAELPDLRATPVPRWELINFAQYAAMNLQMSRGCPSTATSVRSPRCSGARRVSKMPRRSSPNWTACTGRVGGGTSFSSMIISSDKNGMSRNTSCRRSSSGCARGVRLFPSIRKYPSTSPTMRN